MELNREVRTILARAISRGYLKREERKRIAFVINPPAPDNSLVFVAVGNSTEEDEEKYTEALKNVILSTPPEDEGKNLKLSREDKILLLQALAERPLSTDLQKRVKELLLKDLPNLYILWKWKDGTLRDKAEEYRSTEVF